MFRVINKIEKSYDENVTLFFEDKISTCEYLSEESRKLINKVIEKEKFTGKFKETIKFTFLENGYLVTLTYVGAGKKEEFTEDRLRELLFSTLSKMTGNILLSSEEPDLCNTRILTEIFYNINYSFDVYKEKKNAKINLDIFKEQKTEGMGEDEILAISTNITRALIDEPANIIKPESLAETAEALGREFGFATEILEEDKIKELGMEAFLAVGRASINKPKLIVMRYFGDKTQRDKKYGLIGKGLTFDSGGLCIKPADGMLGMKEDMGGAATVIGTMCSLAKLGVKKNVIAIVAACENSISSNAYRPGDILTTMSGKTVEVINTDAEGRLTLADAITYAIRIEKVSEILDVATLTGAMMVALGFAATGVYSNSDEKYLALESAGKYWGEKYWRMPLFDEYGELMKSDVADLKNSGGRWGGANSAAKFLEEFTEGLPWMHLDIAGTAFSDKDKKWIKKGATGVAVKTIYTYIKNMI